MKSATDLGDEVKFVIITVAVRRQFMGNLRDIEANPGDRNLQAEFLACKDILWERMNAEDRAVVDAERARVRELVKPRERIPTRKQCAPVAA